MFGRKKEQLVREKIREHMAVVVETVISMVGSIEAYVKGDFDEAKDKAVLTHNLESKADELRRDIISNMYKGAFFPSIREDLTNYVAKQDKMADSAESCCDFIIAQKPGVPENLAAELLSLARLSCDCVTPLEQAVSDVFEDYDAVRSSIHTVNTKEEEADALERHLTEKVFLSENLSLAEKLHLREFIFHIVHISDVAEDAADMLDAVIIKRSV